MRKKRLITMIILVVVCALFLTVIAYILMRKDAEEYIRWQAQYKGVWVSSDGKYEMTVRRVTSAHVIFSFSNKERGLSLEYACATAGEEAKYSFQYDLSRKLVGTVSAGYGEKGSGTIRLQDESVALDVKAIEGFHNCLEFQGSLKKKSGLADKNRTDLQTMMGKSIPEDYSESKSLYVLEGEQGRINRTHITWDADRRENEYEGYEMNGINSLCLLSDLESKFGDPIEEEALERNRHKRTYEKDGYRYWFITDGYGVVVEGDCQYPAPENGRREGDFLMKGDTVIRYVGDYGVNRMISLPEGTKRIAGGAFSVAQNLCPVEYIYTTELSIPEGVVVEKDAFRNCGKMRITLEEGWTSVPAQAFAHMVEKGTAAGKSQWVKVTLPSSLRRLEDRAFETNWYDANDLSQESDVEIMGVQPVSVFLNDELEYVGDNALYGIMNSTMPKKLKHLGANYYLSVSTLETEERSITGPTKDATFLETPYIIAVPEQLEEVAENGLEIKASLMDDMDGYSNPIVVKMSDECKAAPCLLNQYVVEYEVGKGNQDYRSQNGWLFSKDGKVLYATTCRVNYNGKDRGSNFRFYRATSRGEANRTEIYIPEGVKEVAAYALSDFADECVYTLVSVADETLLRKSIDEHQYVLPKSLKRVARNALFSDGNYLRQFFEVKITGNVPRFYGEFPADFEFQSKIYVKKQDREKFIVDLIKGQELTEKQKTKLEKCIVGY